MKLTPNQQRVYDLALSLPWAQGQMPGHAVKVYRETTERLGGSESVTVRIDIAGRLKAECCPTCGHPNENSWLRDTFVWRDGRLSTRRHFPFSRRISRLEKIKERGHA